jgi:ketosteroid isomerase-like protein
MKKIFLVLFALTLLAGTSCTNTPDTETTPVADPEADKEALAKISAEDWDANVLAGNMEANIEFYTDDAVRIQDGMIYTGKEAIRALLTAEVRPGFIVATCENTVDDIRVSGHLATVRGQFLGSWAHQEWGDTLWTKAAWMDICERQEDGSWKMVFSMGTELRE